MSMHDWFENRAEYILQLEKYKKVKYINDLIELFNTIVKIDYPDYSQVARFDYLVDSITTRDIYLLELLSHFKDD